MKRVKDQYLIDLALGRLEPYEREALEVAIRRDPVLAQRHRAIADHLARYDALDAEPAPSPPPYARVSAHLPTRPDDASAWSRRGWKPRWPELTAATAVVALAIAFGVLRFLGGGDGLGGREGDVRKATAFFGVASEGVRVTRASEVLEGADVPLAPGDRLTTAAPAEARLGDRIRVVLDGGADLHLLTPTHVRLSRGQAFFEVAPGPFSVDTPHGAVTVVGTAFEIRLDNGIEIHVEEGSVRHQGLLVPAGNTLSRNAVGATRGEVGAWFRRPRLALALPERIPSSAGDASGDGTGGEGALVFSNPSSLPVSIAGPDPVRTAFWLEIEAPGGEVHDLPVARVEEPTEDGSRPPLRPGVGLDLEPGASIRIPFHLGRAFDEEGRYRCRAMYRPEGRPPLVSGVVTVEVR